MKNIVIFGGGTGLSYLLSGLKHQDINLTVVVTIADNGGSTGKIRDYYDIPAPGDLRRAVVALSAYEDLGTLMNYRFDKKIGEHTIGNLILAALVDINGDMDRAVREYCRLLQVKHEIVPISNDSLQLEAEMQDGSKIIGETDLVKSPLSIKEVHYQKEGKVNPAVMEALKNADAVVLSSGSLFTSIIPNLIFEEIQKELENKKIIYTANLTTQRGETDHYKLSDHVNALNKHLKSAKVDTVIANSNFNVPDEIAKRYHDEGSDFVEIDVNQIRAKLVLDDFLMISDDLHLRHNVDKLAKTIIKEIE